MPDGIAERAWYSQPTGETSYFEGCPAMASSDPEDRALIARIAAAERWGRTADRTAATAPARAGLRAKFARQVDPEGTLGSTEVERRVDQLVHAHMLRMSRKAKVARNQARRLVAAAESADAELKTLGGGGTDAA